MASPDPSASTPRPGLCSVILPSYNRAAFLPEAIGSIRAQRYRDWELVVVDDGSTDDTPAVLERELATLGRPARVVRQPNRGAYAARNRGVEAARGELLAFFDSDDLWLDHHLEAAVAALGEAPDVDWVYAACRRVDHESGRELEPSSFYVEGRPRSFLRLRTRRAGELRVIDDPDAVRCQIEEGLFCGLQMSVIRRRVFDRLRFLTDFRNECEDQLFPIRVLKAGFRLAYFDRVHTVYRVHAGSSAAGAKSPGERRRRVWNEMIRGLEALPGQVDLTSAERRALDRRVARERFWKLGYHSHWAAGERAAALAEYRRALARWPWDPGMWKTFALALARPAPDRASEPAGGRDGGAG